MLVTIAAALLPLMLVFGLYHLMTWFNIFNLNRRVFWRRVALTAALSHGLLAAGFFVFSYFDYQAARAFPSAPGGYGFYLFEHSEFWRLMTIFDTVAMLALIGLFAALDAIGLQIPLVIPVTIAITLAIGTLQWYWLGGAIGMLMERLWEGLKTGDEEDEEWF